jgi:Xaa-Pro aminopeptidase
VLADRISDIQQALAEADLDGWLFAVFQHNDPVSLELLGIPEDHLVTRRCYYLIPTSGAPRKLTHRLEPAMLDHLPGDNSHYLTWKQHRDSLSGLVAGRARLAAQYSPNNGLPSVSRLDAGTVELLRAAGVEPISSADLVQRFAAVWSVEQLETHRRANRHLHAIVSQAFDLVAEKLRAGDEVLEHAVQQFILGRFDQEGLWTESPPIVGVNEHSADPHYQPAAAGSSPIRPGDFLLIDLWAKEKKPASIYGDITWCGVCAAAPTEHQQRIFDIVSGARDAAWQLVSDRFPNQTVRGYEVDDACRGVIEAAGYGEQFFHRTGHSIGIQDHGQGANMDNLETHDTRPLVAMTGFSIEPGIYLEGDFGVRSEINVALTADGAEITGAAPQRDLLTLLS